MTEIIADNDSVEILPQTDSKKKAAVVESTEASGLSQMHIASQQQYEEMQHAAELRVKSTEIVTTYLIPLHLPNM